METEAGVFARELPVIDRHVQVGVAQGRVLSVDFPARPAAEAGHDHPLLDRIDAYLRGKEDGFGDVSVALTLPTERRRVLDAVREIPYGEETTVDRLARMTAGLDDEEGPDAVHRALLANPAPILIADHRVRDSAGATPEDVAEHCRAVEGLR